MAKTVTGRRQAQRRDKHPMSRGAAARRRRRLPWYRKSEYWRWIVAVAAGAGLFSFLAFGLDDQPGDTGTEPFVGGDLHSLVAEPDGARLFVGGHEGVAVSSDEGRTWRQIDSLNGADAMGWAFDGERVLVGGHPGLFISEDGGRTFEQRNDGLPATDIHALGAGGDRIYAASPQVGVFMSTDGGRSWEMRTEQAGQSFMGRILVDPADPDHLVAPDMQAGAAESTDGGRSWSALGGVSGAMWVSWEADNLDHLIAAGIGRAAESTDGGATWSDIAIPSAASAVEIDPSDPSTLYAGVLTGRVAEVWKSTDAGRTWTRA